MSSGKGERGATLFGDLHVHTSYSMDAAMFGLPLVTGSGVTLPPDACDFARYCLGAGLLEWSQGGRTPAEHYGHKNVVFREWEPGRSPTRPISSQEIYTIVKMFPGLARGALSLNTDFRRRSLEADGSYSCEVSSRATPSSQTPGKRCITCAPSARPSPPSTGTITDVSTIWRVNV